MSTAIYQAHHIRTFERKAAELLTVDTATLMERAGKAACDFLLQRWPLTEKIAVFCGNGHNGGDGYQLACYAQARGLEVTVWHVTSSPHTSAKFLVPRDLSLSFLPPVAPIFVESDLENYQPDVIVDALCGIGLQGALRADISEIIRALNDYPCPRLALDIPSGLAADTGTVADVAIYASATITFLGWKLGLLTGAGPSYSGYCVCHQLDLPDSVKHQVTPVADILTLPPYRHYLHPRHRDWHKGQSGSVLIIGGTAGMHGAVLLAAQAALRVGCGKITIATHPHHAYTTAVHCPEIMYYSLSDATNSLPPADVIILGPGLDQGAWSQMAWHLARSAVDSIPCIIDAGGLHFLARHPHQSEQWILTPHPGEAGHLLKTTTKDIQANRLHAVQAIQNQYGGVCVLKGSGSFIATSQSRPLVCRHGNPGMATAGMGDLLSGVIGGLVAQGIPLHDAAALGVYVHAMAGDQAANQYGERGLMPTDLLPYLQQLVNVLP